MKTRLKSRSEERRPSRSRWQRVCAPHFFADSMLEMPSVPPARLHLLECLVYIAVLAVVLVVTMRGFYRCWDNSKALRHNADDIILVLHAGEQWRADVRAARDRCN